MAKQVDEYGYWQKCYAMILPAMPVPEKLHIQGFYPCTLCSVGQT